METGEERTPLISGNLPLSTRLAYALGHIYNDLAAAMWFTYTLIYLQHVVLLQPIVAGSMLLLGQVIDALMTPVFGILVDRYNKKKVWHVIGSLMVLVSFPIIFGSYARPRSPYLMATLVLSITLFQTGWAAVQISHLSMIPALTNSPLIRADLTAIRYSAQVGSAVIVFIVTWIVLPTNEESMSRLGQRDSYKFRNIAIVLTIIGTVTTVLFHLSLKAHLLHVNGTKKSDERNQDNVEGNNAIVEDSSPCRRKPQFGVSLLLRVALLYVASRLFITLATIYMPLYIEEIDIGGKEALATVPLVSYLSSFLAAISLKYMNRSCGTKFCYLLGALIGILSGIVAEFSASDPVIVYTVAILIGASSSITMVTALTVTAELIGTRTENSAFVYSIVTFLDKVVTGLVVILIEKWRCREKDFCPNYNRDTLSSVCILSMVLGLLALISVARCLT